MKKLLTLLFALAVAFSLTMPVFAQEAPAGQGTAAGQEAPKVVKHKKKKAPKEKKKKKGGKETKTEEAPKQ